MTANPAGGPYISADQYALLFSPHVEHTWWYRDYLRVMVLEVLAQRGFHIGQQDIADTDDALEQALFDTDEENQ